MSRAREKIVTASKIALKDYAVLTSLSFAATMQIRICHGHFSGQSAQYLSLHNADSANLLIDGQFAILPISWLSMPPRCHSFRTPTKSMRFPERLEDRLRAYAAILEQQDLQVVTAQENNSNAEGQRVLEVRQKTSVTSAKKPRKSRSRKRSQTKSKIAV